jgi:hypothetical protein
MLPGAHLSFSRTRSSFASILASASVIVSCYPLGLIRCKVAVGSCGPGGSSAFAMFPPSHSVLAMPCLWPHRRGRSPLGSYEPASFAIPGIVLMHPRLELTQRTKPQNCKATRPCHCCVLKARNGIDQRKSVCIKRRPARLESSKKSVEFGIPTGPIGEGLAFTKMGSV